MSSLARSLLAAAGLLAAAPLALAQLQIADLRLEAEAFPEKFTVFDPGFGPLPTRQTKNSLPGVEITFSGLSQNIGQPAPDDKDIGLRTYHVSTNISQLNRFACEPQDSKLVHKVGAVQWTLDLSGLERELAARKSSIESLDLVLVLGGAADMKCDLYLSPGRAAPGAPALDIADYTPEDLYRLLWLPAQARQLGDLIPVQSDHEAALGGPASHSFRLVKRGAVAPDTATIDLASLYKAGVRKLSLVLTSGSFGAKRNLEIREGSGLFLVTTSAR